jgi:oxygen-independent coproporphyrinogen-3 oxidase
LTPSAERATLSAAAGLYLHIPFCLRKCPYCSFFSVAAEKDLQNRFLRALSLQINRLAEIWPSGDSGIATIFFGGGTPTVLAPATLVGMLEEAAGKFPLPVFPVETTIEINPATIEARGIALLVDSGFNRISVGVQSLDDGELAFLGRAHDRSDALRCIQAIRAAGCSNLNLDLIYGLPGQTPAAWRRTLEQVLELEPDHLAIYELTIEGNTPFARWQQAGRWSLPPEEELLAMLDITVGLTGKAGFERYEISNYARPGRQCRHNINYWRNGTYIGLGPGAVSCLAGRRYQAVRDIGSFCRCMEEGIEPWEEVEELDREGRFRETVVIGLRMTAGVSVPELRRRFGIDMLAYYGPLLARLAEQGLIALQGERVRLTAAGLLVADRVLAELV